MNLLLDIVVILVTSYCKEPYQQQISTICCPLCWLDILATTKHLKIIKFGIANTYLQLEQSFKDRPQRQVHFSVFRCNQCVKSFLRDVFPKSMVQALTSRQILISDLMEYGTKYSQVAQLFPLLLEVLLYQEDPVLGKKIETN